MPKTTQRGLVDAESWADYRWHLANRIVNVDMLRSWIDVTDDEAAAIEACAGVYRWSITPYYAALMDPVDPDCPVRRQAVPTMSEFVRNGRVKALGTTGLARSAVLPDVPTIAEAGVPNYEATIWLGLMAPKATPTAVLRRLNAEVATIVGRADTVAAWKAQGTVPMTMGIEAFTRYIDDDIAKWARIVKISGAKPDQ